ncbi:AAA family ATPase [Pseudomonas sp. Marseille-QA0892]
MSIRKEITEVFTPRQGEVNTKMYVDRPLHERSLTRALKRNSHTLLFGDSGNGKSWLYKKVMKENGIPYVVANCANASRMKSITQEVCNCLVEPGTVTKLGFSEEKAAEVSAYFAKGGVKHSGNYDVSQEEPLLKAFKMFSGTTPDRKIIVLDNLESIFNSKELMDELADIVILLDDDRYASCNINILIVGVPNGVLQYFSETKNLESVSNRIQEVEKVASLDSGQVMEIIRKGFDQLSIKITGQTLIDLSDHVWDVTLGIAQRVHEYCECLAYEIEDNAWKFDKALLQKADLSWLKQGLRQSYHVIETHLNSRETAVARRNQVIYCIAKIRQHQFDSNDIDALIRKEFPTTIPETNMGIGSILGELAKGDSPLLNRNDRNNSYSVRDPRYLMCIRVALYKDQVSEKVVKKQFSR